MHARTQTNTELDVVKHGIGKNFTFASYLYFIDQLYVVFNILVLKNK